MKEACVVTRSKEQDVCMSWYNTENGPIIFAMIFTAPKINCIYLPFIFDEDNLNFLSININCDSIVGYILSCKMFICQF